MPGIDDPLMKVIRANEHLDSLEAELVMFYIADPPAATIEEDTETGIKTIRVKMSVPPVRLGIIAGDAVSALRESLDHLAWQLASLTKDPPYERTEFPLCTVWDRNSERRFGQVTQDIPPTAVEIIQSLQPHHKGEAFRSDPLWQIDKLWNVAKHQVVPLNANVMQFGANIGPEHVAEFRRLNEREHAMVLTAEGSAQVQLNEEVTSGVTFGSRRHEVVGNLGDLRALYEHVAKTVFPKFHVFFGAR